MHPVRNRIYVRPLSAGRDMKLPDKRQTVKQYTSNNNNNNKPVRNDRLNCYYSEQNSFRSYCVLGTHLLAAIAADTFFIIILRHCAGALGKVYRLAGNRTV